MTKQDISTLKTPDETQTAARVDKVKSSLAFVKRVKDIQGTARVARILAFQAELDDLLPPATSIPGIEGKVNGKFRQCLGNLILWYGQWEKNRDYSSAINASMALGKLSTATEMLYEFRSEGSNVKLDGVIANVTAISSDCWERIGNAAGRIIPFE